MAIGVIQFKLLSHRFLPRFQLVDLNGDGKLDPLLPFASTTNVWTIKAAAGMNTGTFQTPKTLISGSAYGFPIALPLNRVGQPAILLFPIASSTTPKIEVLINESH